MVPLAFFFCGVGLVALIGATSSAIFSSSVDRAEEREESESAMIVVCDGCGSRAVNVNVKGGALGPCNINERRTTRRMR